MTIRPFLPQDGDTYYGQSEAVAAGMLRTSLLRACAKCNAVHPWARKPPLRQWECPDCGHPCAPAEHKIVRARLPGILGWFVDVLYGIGDYLRRQSERLEK